MIEAPPVAIPTLERYSDKIERIHPSPMTGTPRASVVIVAYGTPPEVLQRNVELVSGEGIEVIVIDNSPSGSSNPFERSGAGYVAMRGNAGVCVGRNLGAVLARAAIVIYLDDDALPAEGFVEAHLREHSDPRVLAVRGRCLPRTRNFPNRLAFHYDLGPERIPSPIDLEGNSSFKRAELLACGGFNEALPLAGGWEGVDLSYRLVMRSGDPASVLYSPVPTIRHDYKANAFELLTKLIRHRRNLGEMSRGQVDLNAFLLRYERERNPLHRMRRALLVYRSP